MNPILLCILLILCLKVESFQFNTKTQKYAFLKTFNTYKPISNLNGKTSIFANTRQSDVNSKRLNINDKFKAIHSTKIDKLTRLVGICIIFSISTLKMASATSVTTEVIKSKLHPLQSSLLWLTLFLSSAALHSAESAITKISPWKVQSFVEDEGPESPFSTLSTRMTTLLSTILIATTACSIYSTALFVSTASELFPRVSLGFLTAVLTAVTLFFGELLPKALAVSNSELVARKLVPVINRMSWILSPLTGVMTGLSELVLTILGMKSNEDNNVTEDMLRLVVNEAERSEGIEIGEGRMIKGVLDMQETEVNKIMQPRVDVVALPEDASASQILETALATRYSRIPVYKGDIDNISGVVFSKDLLQYVNQDFADKGSTKDSQSWKNLSAVELMQPTYFIPESMKAWNALQEMRRRRIHMAIIVDEYGGTSGLVTFEDLLEEVVGEIYDEDDFEEQEDDIQTIFKNVDGTFSIRGYAELDDVCEALQISIDENMKAETTTIGGLLCNLAGQIPKEGFSLNFAGYSFVVSEVEDNRRIITLSASKIEAASDTDTASSDSSSGQASGDGKIITAT